MAEHFEDFIKFAIGEEQAAGAMYEKYSEIVGTASTKEVLKSMAAMERGHEAKLKKILEKGRSVEDTSLPKPGTVIDMSISDFLVTPGINENSDIQDVFIFAMKAEEKASNLYTKLAALDELDTETKTLLESLAAEEKKHKLDLESEYETAFMKDN
jgi:rubrerythrin